jgi:hypothetical protein
MKLKIVSDGTLQGTKLVDAMTNEAVVLDGFQSYFVAKGSPNEVGIGSVTLLFPHVIVESTPEVKAPYKIESSQSHSPTLIEGLGGGGTHK